MNTMGILMNGILLGDGAVSTYLDVLSKKEIGKDIGLFQKTTNCGYRKRNCDNNNPRMSSYYSVQSKLSYGGSTKLEDQIMSTDSKRYLAGNLVTAYNVDGIPIGYAYTTDINNNTLSRGYSLSSDFDKLQSLLREKSLDEIHNGDENNFTYSRYVNVDNLNRTTKNIEPLNRGDFFKIRLDNYRRSHGVLRNNKDTLKSLSNNSTSYYNNNDYYAVKSDKGNFAVINDIISGGVYQEKIVETAKDGLFRFEKRRKSYIFYDEKDGEIEIGEIGESTSSQTQQDTIVSIKSITNNPNNYSNLLQKTNELFKQHKINSLINRFHTDSIEKIGQSELITSVTEEYGLSRGRNLLKSQEHRNNNKDGYDNPYCRVWTAHHQYSRMEDRIRPFVDDNNLWMGLDTLHKNIGTGLRPNNAPDRLNNFSVLQSNGFLKITPTYEKKGDNIKNYMFSIENLAWKDFNGVLSNEQKGPNNGRIMWFPPYNLKFTENVNVSWNDNNFIGRGEKIYTYTNTERSGTLSFTLLIDHPSILNSWRGVGSDYFDSEMKEKEETMLRFFAGCEPLVNNVSNETEEKSDEIKNEVPNINPKVTTKQKRIAYVIFFPNNYTGYDKKTDFDAAVKELFQYEIDDKGGDWNENNTPDIKFKNETIKESNISKYKLNAGGGNQSDIKKILLGSDDEYIDLKYLDDIVSVSGNDLSYIINNEDDGESLFNELKLNSDVSNIEVMGFASSHGRRDYNIQLAKRRADFIKNLIKKKCDFLDINVPFLNTVAEEKKVNDIGNKNDMNTFEAKVARSAMVIFNINKKVDSIPVNETGVNGVKKEYSPKSATKNELTQTTEENINNIYTYDNEYLYFKEVAKDDYFIKNIVNRIRHFDPAYHSITPEGFNARLTFLHQCTRQGPTNSVSGGYVNSESKNYLKYAGNLSFGRAPYCILRIGDFFNTKILIDSISIDYDNGGGTQWDLNPEGVGVQPMLANVNINFKFVGGQDISGPIERLQNAVTSNYYANASIYDKLADYKNIDGTEIRHAIGKQ